MVSRIREPEKHKIHVPKRLLKPTAVVVLLGCLGAALPLAIPQIAQSDIRASTNVQLMLSKDAAEPNWNDFEDYLRAQLLSDSALMGALAMVSHSTDTLDLSVSPKLLDIVTDLIGLTQTPAADDPIDQMRRSLGEHLTLTLEGEPLRQVTIAITASDAELAIKLADYFAVVTKAQTEAFHRGSGDVELALARDALDQVEAELTGFQLRHGDASIQQMQQLDQDFGQARREVEALRSERRDIAHAIEVAKSLKPSQALSTPLPSVIGFDALSDLQQDYARAKAQLSALGVDYGPKHPKMLAVQSQIDQLSSGVAKALKQSREELLRSEQAIAGTLKAAETKLADLDERMAKLGNLPDSLKHLEKRLDAARQHFLSLSEIARPSDMSSAITAQMATSPVEVSPVYNGALLGLYSAVSSLLFGLAGYIGLSKFSTRRSREKVIPKHAAPLPATISDRAKARETAAELRERLQHVREKEPVAATAPKLWQDNDAPFDLRIKELLMRNATIDHDRKLQSLPELVRAAAMGEITLSESEKSELSTIQRELEELRHALSVQQGVKSQHSVAI